MTRKPYRRIQPAMSLSGEYRKHNSNNMKVRAIGYARALDFAHPKPSKSDYYEVDYERINIGHVKEKLEKKMPNIRTYFTCSEDLISFSPAGWMQLIIEVHPGYGLLDGYKKGDVVGQINVIAEKGHPVNEKAGLEASHRLRLLTLPDGTQRDMHIVPICSIFACRTNKYCEAGIRKEWLPPTFAGHYGNLLTFYLQFYQRYKQSVIEDPS